MKRGGAQGSYILSMICVRAVREIEARHVHAGAQEAVDNSRGAAGGSNRADNFGVAKGHFIW
jgi:hypothetical protein